MRLTLDTLLAYLDDVLEPAEAQLLGEKIQQSEHATKLVHRIRECMRQDKLGAPRLQGRAAGLDANTVSEYLDHTLSAERIVDFEKYCLESEVHLAETACCHQILALVLGEPALVDPASRRRIYNLLANPESRATGTAQTAAAQTAAVATGAADDGFPQPSSKVAPRPAPKKGEVPDYLREMSGGASAWWKVAAVLLVAVLLVCVVVMAVGPLWRDDGTKKTSVSTGDGANLPIGDGARIGPKVDLGKGEAVKPDPPKIDQHVPEVKENHGPVVVEGPKLPEKAVSAEVLPPPLTSVENPLRTEKVPEQVKVAQLTSLETVLLRLDPQGNRWSRVPAAGSLSSGDLLVSPPASNNTLTLRGELTVHVLGDTRLELLKSAGPDQAPGIRLHHGRLRLMMPGDPKSPLVLHAGERQAKVTFAADGAVVAVEVRLVRTPGSDPRTTPSRTVVDLVMGNGKIIWEEAGEPPLMLDAPGRRTLGLVEGEPQPEGRPDWVVRTEQLSGTEQLGLKALEEKVRDAADQDVAETLMDWVVVPQSEIHTMAFRWLIAIDRFDAAITALGSSARRQAWPKIIEQLRQAVARDRPTAEAVFTALKQARDEKADGLFRMLWGYSEQDLAGGEAAKLVGYLDHADLDYRVVSSWCLCDITGTGFNVFYRPDAPAELRETHVRRWQQRLKAGDIGPPKKKQ